jgi:hypothetical protein
MDNVSSALEHNVGSATRKNLVLVSNNWHSVWEHYYTNWKGLKVWNRCRVSARQSRSFCFGKRIQNQ